MSTDVLILPGLGGSGPQHWQSLWEHAYPGFERIQQRDWDHPVCGEWVAEIERAVKKAGPSVVLAAHSLGCLAIAHWAASKHAPIMGALLVAVPDSTAPDWPAEISGFSATPAQPLDFRSIVVASTDDTYGTLSHAAGLARNWGSTLVNIGARGHINGSSGLGDWPEGFALLNELRN
jgi:serine hydrolase